MVEKCNQLLTKSTSNKKDQFPTEISRATHPPSADQVGAGAGQVHAGGCWRCRCGLWLGREWRGRSLRRLHRRIWLYRCLPSVRSAETTSPPTVDAHQTRVHGHATGGVLTVADAVGAVVGGGGRGRGCGGHGRRGGGRVAPVAGALAELGHQPGVLLKMLTINACCPNTY